jgi:hypothetical protein
MPTGRRGLWIKRKGFFSWGLHQSLGDSLLYHMPLFIDGPERRGIQARFLDLSLVGVSIKPGMCEVTSEMSKIPPGGKEVFVCAEDDRLRLPVMMKGPSLTFDRPRLYLVSSPVEEHG